MYNQKDECKLMILYLLKNVCFPLTHENLSNYFLGKNIPFIKFEGILSELIDTKLIIEHKTKITTCYELTQDGIEAINLFINEITPTHIKELNKYIKDNKIKLKDESIINSNFTDGENGNFVIKLEINENKDDTFKIEMDVPTNDVAITMCENWKNKAKEIYAYIMKQLL